MVLKVWPVFLVGLLLAGPARAQESDLIAVQLSGCKSDRSLVLAIAKNRDRGAPESKFINIMHDTVEKEPYSQAFKNQEEASYLKLLAEVYGFRSLPGEYLAEQDFQRCIEKVGQ